jgi:hypothetical protein
MVTVNGEEVWDGQRRISPKFAAKPKIFEENNMRNAVLHLLKWGYQPD